MSPTMTPQEIFEYKMRWKPNATAVPIHSDLTTQAKDWCRRNLNRTEWSMDTWTDVYEHTFYFKDSMDAAAFKTEFSKWIVKSADSEEFY